MIVISVSLVLIGLLVWAIGDNYHFSTDIMANQEIDSMTPKHGYTIVFYDTAQPIGAKLRLLDAASNMEDAQQKLARYSKELNTDKATVLIFNETFTANQKQVMDTIDAVSKVQAAMAQAVKDQEAQVQNAKNQNASQPTTPVTPITTPPTQNITLSNTTKIVISAAPKISIPINDTVVTSISNSTISGKPNGATDNLGINANVTISHSAGSANHTQTLPLSEHVSVSSQ